ncbi:MAG: hypothetical protein H7Y08_06275 [Rhizobiaceae bacterium]|nr:hypothetical protein [Rhizobiaceae bacterium]
MVDAIQGRSSIPLPATQTEEALNNKPPLNSPRDIADQTAASVETKGETQKDSFERFLNEKSITLLERSQQGTAFDPVAALTSGSVYRDPGESTPL